MGVNFHALGAGYIVFASWALVTILPALGAGLHLFLRMARAWHAHGTCYLDTWNRACQYVTTQTNSTVV